MWLRKLRKYSAIDDGPWMAGEERFISERPFQRPCWTAAELKNTRELWKISSLWTRDFELNSQFDIFAGDSILAVVTRKTLDFDTYTQFHYTHPWLAWLSYCYHVSVLNTRGTNVLSTETHRESQMKMSFHYRESTVYTESETIHLGRLLSNYSSHPLLPSTEGIQTSLG